MKTIPAISVIMSVKNGASFLEKSVPSILNQTYEDFEFIICNDGSTDETQALLDKYKLQDERILLLKNEQPMGLAYSLNRCIEIARSEILARQDADDRSALNRFEVQLPFVQSHPEYAIVGTCWINETTNGIVSKRVVPEIPTAKSQIARGQYMHPTWMMRKSMIEEVGYYTANKYTLRDQDYHLVMKVLAAGMKIYNMQEFLYYYFVDQNQRFRQLQWDKVKGLMWIRWDSYRRNKLPFWSYVFVLKPLAALLIPQKIMLKYYNRTNDGQNNQDIQ